MRINKRVIKRSKTEVFDGGKKKQEEMIREEEDRKKSNLNEQLCVSMYVIV